MVKTASPTADHDEGHVHDRRTHLVGQGIARGAGAATLAKARAGSKLSRWPANGLAHELISLAEQLIVRGKEQGYLTPDDILQVFPVCAAFKEIGIEVTDGEKDFEEVEQIDDEMLLEIEVRDSVSLDDPIRMY